MQDIPGVSCGCGDRDRSDGSPTDGSERCEECGSQLEWRLALNGVTRLECPRC